MRNSILFHLALLLAFPLFSQNFSFEYDGIERTYALHLPEEYDSEKSHPLVINMHGAGSNAFQQQIYTEFNNLADNEGVVVVYPNAVDGLWNIDKETGVDDVGFVSALMDTIAFHFNIDMTRVYACGMSMGGFMSYRLACQLDNRIAAIASVTGLLRFEPCEPKRPFPVLQIHGTEDNLVPYDGVYETIAFWTGFNDCPSDSIVYDLPDIDTSDQSTVTVTEYFPCQDSTRVQLYTIIGGGHTWPGAFPIAGITNQDIDANVEIWNFFRQYTLEGISQVDERAVPMQKIRIYPNPVSESATIEIIGQDHGSCSIRVLDLSGREIRSGIIDYPATSFHFQRDGLQAGTYIIEVRSGERTLNALMILK